VTVAGDKEVAAQSRRLGSRLVAVVAALLASAVLAGCMVPRPAGDSPLRYRDQVFSSVTVTRDLQYGSAPDANGNPVALKLDLYQPSGDTQTKRPAVVWVHGGSFCCGDKTSPEIVDEATTFAKLGYVVLCPDVPTTVGPPLWNGAFLPAIHQGTFISDKTEKPTEIVGAKFDPKKLVSFDCAIDFLAGPTEALVVQHSGRPDFIAGDLVAQAEHDPEAVCVFITSSATLAKKVEKEVALQAESNPIALASLQENGVILVASSRKQAMQWANQIASEHLTVEERDLPLVRNAGSVFASAYSAQAAGDYIVGPNHVLPTAGIARSLGGLTVLDFVKVITVQQMTRQGIRRVGPAAIRLAEAEGLAAHAESLRLRVNHA